MEGRRTASNEVAARLVEDLLQRLGGGYVSPEEFGGMRDQATALLEGGALLRDRLKDVDAGALPIEPVFDPRREDGR